MLLECREPRSFELEFPLFPVPRPVEDGVDVDLEVDMDEIEPETELVEEGPDVPLSTDALLSTVRLLLRLLNALSSAISRI